MSYIRTGMYHSKIAGIAMSQEFDLSQIVYVATKCTECGLEGVAPTLKHIIEDDNTFLSKMLDRLGYAEIHCGPCAEKAVENSEA